MSKTLNLNFNLTFQDLYSVSGLTKLDQIFQDWTSQEDPVLSQRYHQARSKKEISSELLIDLAPYVENFLAELFRITPQVESLQKQALTFKPIHYVKRFFVMRQVANAYTSQDTTAFCEADLRKILSQHMDQPFDGDELVFATYVQRWMESKDQYVEPLEAAKQYAAWALYNQQGQEKHREGTLFNLPQKLDFQNLVEEHEIKERPGFSLRDPGVTLVQAQDQATYCIKCHPQKKDSCSQGMKDKEGHFKTNELGNLLIGCPLDEKISEMNQVRGDGYLLGALGIVMIDNPMVAATGHRICNDCMKGCIFQKQTPVNVPAIETQTLKAILNLPWGFEIYSLLTRWNPLNIMDPLPQAESGYKVLVVGMGPAGFTLAHYLLRSGHQVVGIDGLRIEPMPADILDQPICDIRTIREDLSDRITSGFGGVAEYGITNRWDKNFLKIIRLILERHDQFLLKGGVRFGSTITEDQAFQLGFDHVALCLGAGKPNMPQIPNILAPGVRMASDFLMNLQLSGAFKKDSIANLTVQLPIVVVGGGLTAIDTATEALAYYPLQVEKFLSRYEILVDQLGKEVVEEKWTLEDHTLAETFLNHGRALRAARSYQEKLTLLQKWGGATILYRKSLQDSPAYRLNHEEITEALAEGVWFKDNLAPVGVSVDEHGDAKGLKVSDTNGNIIEIPARTILIATGTEPNTVLNREALGSFKMDGKYFGAIDGDGNAVTPETSPKPENTYVLTKDRVSFFGDLHPSFKGSVVRAIASAKKGYPVVNHVLSKNPPKKEYNSPFQTIPALFSTTPAKAGAHGFPPSRGWFLSYIDQLLTATVLEINRLTPTIVEVIIHAPLAAGHFKPGQFYRLENFETYAEVVNGTRLKMEGIAATGASVDPEKGTISLIILEMGGSSRLVANLKPGEPVVLMGPTGSPTDIPKGETVCLVGGGLGNAVLFSIGKALRANGCHVLYFAAYKTEQDIYKVPEIEAAADQVIWCVEGSSSDTHFQGNVVQALHHHKDILSQVDRFIVIGSDKMMAAVTGTLQTTVKPYLKENVKIIGSINSPMQCMMKEICAQCLQSHIDPITGKETFVFSCFNQDQDLKTLSFDCLSGRLSQNSLAEKLTDLWVRTLFPVMS